MSSNENVKLRSVQFIRKNGIGKLLENFKLRMKVHKTYQNIVQLSYSQLASPFKCEEVHECRNLILDRSKDYKVVAWGFKKFFNYGETNALKINWDNDVSVYEKIDGSIILMYHYNGCWNVSSSTVPDAGGKAHGKGSSGNLSFCDMFWKVWKNVGYPLPTDTNKCYTFELFTKSNVIIVREHAEGDQIILLGVRDVETLEEERPEPYAERFGWKITPIYPDLRSLEQVVEAAKSLNPMKSEGFVVCEHVRDHSGSFRRIKVKSPAYVSIHSLRLNPGKDPKKTKELNRRRLVKVLITNEHDEFLSYFPQFKNTYEHLKVVYIKFTEYVRKHFEDFREDVEKQLESRKEEQGEEQISLGEYLRRGRTFSEWNKSIYALLSGRKSSGNEEGGDQAICKILGYKNFYLPILLESEMTIQEYLSERDVKQVEKIFSLFERNILKMNRRYIDMIQQQQQQEEEEEEGNKKKKKKKKKKLEKQKGGNQFTFDKLGKGDREKLDKKWYEEEENVLYDMFGEPFADRDEEEELEGEGFVGNKDVDNEEEEEEDFISQCTFGRFYEESIKGLIRSKEMSKDMIRKRDELVSKLIKQFESKYQGVVLDDDEEKKWKFEIIPFGSTATNTALSNSDFDLYLRFVHPNEEKEESGEGHMKRDGQVEENVLYVLNTCLYKDIRSAVTSNRVFVFKFRDPKLKIRVDLTIFNPQCVLKRDYITKYMNFDERARLMTLFVKCYMKIRNIGDSSKKFLNSFAVTLMIIMFLESRIPPILPLKHDTLNNKMKRNRESLSKLIHDFFQYYCDFDYDNFAISTVREGKPLEINRLSEKLQKSKSPKIIVIEDPFEKDQNCGRTVSRKSKEKTILEFGRIRDLMEKKEGIFKICSSPITKQKRRGGGSKRKKKKKKRRRRR